MRNEQLSKDVEVHTMKKERIKRTRKVIDRIENDSKSLMKEVAFGRDLLEMLLQNPRLRTLSVLRKVLCFRRLIYETMTISLPQSSFTICFYQQSMHLSCRCLREVTKLFRFIWLKTRHFHMSILCGADTKGITF